MTDDPTLITGLRERGLRAPDIGLFVPKEPLTSCEPHGPRGSLAVPQHGGAEKSVEVRPRRRR